MIPLIRVMRPDAREAIGLQLERDLQAVASGLARAPLRRAHLVRRAEQVLHVMADFVADHIRLREVARTAETREIREERGVEIHAAIGRAIERSDRGRRVAAGRLHGAVEQRELGRFVTPAGGREDLAPDILGAAEDRGHELARLVVGRERRALLRGRSAPAAALEQILHGLRAAEQIGDDEHGNAGERAAATERDRHPGAHPATALLATDVADVLAAPQVLPAHRALLGTRCLAA